MADRKIDVGIRMSLAKMRCRRSVIVEDLGTLGQINNARERWEAFEAEKDRSQTSYREMFEHGSRDWNRGVSQHLEEKDDILRRAQLKTPEAAAIFLKEELGRCSELADREAIRIVETKRALERMWKSAEEGLLKKEKLLRCLDTLNDSLKNLADPLWTN
ncbi:hypothetical protein NHQ30_005296 [Ciborinia camelliae]|nr:hypothetical protein NHQ30_005296 [Ciborinia camelliae]